MNLTPPLFSRRSARRLTILFSSIALATSVVAQTPEAAPAPDLLPAPITPPAPAAPTTAAAAAAGEPASITMNFQGTSLSDVLTYLSEAAGFIIVQEATVSGTVNVVSRQPVNPDEAVDLLNTVLVDKGYTAIRNGRILKIVSRKDAQKRDLPVQMGADPERIPRKDELVTQILPLHYGEAGKLVENIRPLLSDAATISANDASNAILLTDTQTNIRRIAQIIKALDTSVASISSIEVFQLQFADAKEVADVLTQLFSSGQSRGNQPQGGFGGRGGRGFGFGFGPPGGPGGGAQQSPQSEAKQAVSRIVAVADQQSNSVIVSAPEDNMPTIREIVKQIDTNITDVTDTRVFRLTHADAVELADIINNLYSDQTGQQGRNNGNNNGRRGQGGFGGFPGGPQPAAASGQSERSLLQARVMAVGDPRTNSLLVNASKDSMTQIASLVTRLDSTDAKKQRVYVHSLQHADVDNVAAVLRGMLGQQSGSGVGTVQTGVSRLTERTSTGAAMDASQVLSNSGNGRSTR